MAPLRWRPLRTTTIASEFAAIKADYAAARPSRFRRTRTSLGGSADSHYTDTSLHQIREYCRDMIRNDDAPGSLMDAAKRNIVQDRGLEIEPQTGDRKLDLEIWARWNEWGSDARLCDARGMNTLWALQNLALEHLVVDGDLFALPLDDGTLQFVEADLCSSPTTANSRGVVCGIRHDAARRRPAEYWFLEDSSPKYHTRRTIGDYRQIPAFDENGEPNVFHLLDPRRISQSRGVPWFAPIFDTLGMFEDTNFAALVQQQMVSCIAAFFVSPQGDIQLGTRDTQTADDGTTEDIEALSPGLTLRLRPGEDVKGFSPNVPAPAYFELSKNIVRRICARIGVPPEVTFFDTTDTTFHGYRGAVNQARIGFQCVQRTLAQRLWSPVYRWKVRDWLPELGATAARLSQPTANRRATLFDHRWDKPGWDYVDPLKDAQADAVQLQNNLDSPRGIAARRGRDHDDVIRETVEDNRGAILAAIRAAEGIKEETGVEVSWRDILNRAAPERFTIRGDLGSTPDEPASTPPGGSA